MTIDSIRAKSEVLAEMEQKRGKLKIIGGMYDINKRNSKFLQIM